MGIRPHPSLIKRRKSKVRLVTEYIDKYNGEYVIKCTITDGVTVSAHAANKSLEAAEDAARQRAIALLPSRAPEPQVVPPPPPLPTPAEISPVQMSVFELKEESDRLIQQLGWGATEGKDYLFTNYNGARGRNMLSHEQYVDFVIKLRQLVQEEEK